MQLPTDKTNADGEPELSIVQKWFQSVITHPDGVIAGIESDRALELVPLKRDELERMVTSSSKVSAVERLSIYAHAYHARLIECLGESFPILKRTLGEDVFNGFAFGYIQHFPSKSYTLNLLGGRFIEYLELTRPDRGTDAPQSSKPPLGWPDFLIDLATLEWTIDQVFDGPGIERKRTLLPEDIQGIAPSLWLELRLVVSPCVQLLNFRFPVNAFYSEMRLAAKDVQIEPPAPRESCLAVTRRDYIVRRHELSKVQFELLKSLAEGKQMNTALEHASGYTDMGDEEFALCLRSWFAEWAGMQLFESTAA